jgi:hypothetical protein
MNSRRFEIRTSFPPFSKGLRIPSMADDDWTEESRFESRSGERRKGFDFESFMLIILRHHAPIEWIAWRAANGRVEGGSGEPAGESPGTIPVARRE